ncbi:hypothetical protein [Winogradskya humida]|uniref:hypothetical protein n=1 Tax=Winogradskya humida TaxID=113566 RepID=UPI001940B33A|nr:hypothetical protein [Actinoplanes humidus]
MFFLGRGRVIRGRPATGTLPKRDRIPAANAACSPATSWLRTRQGAVRRGRVEIGHAEEVQVQILAPDRDVGVRLRLPVGDLEAEGLIEVGDVVDGAAGQ